MLMYRLIEVKSPTKKPQVSKVRRCCDADNELVTPHDGGGDIMLCTRSALPSLPIECEKRNVIRQKKNMPGICTQARLVVNVNLNRRCPRETVTRRGAVSWLYRFGHDNLFMLAKSWAVRVCCGSIWPRYIGGYCYYWGVGTVSSVSWWSRLGRKLATILDSHMSNTEDDYSEKRIKIVLVGDSAAGKTSIAVKFCNDEFSRQYTPTAGIDFYLKNLSLGVYKNVSIHLWDISGLSLRGNMLDKYIYEANIVMLVYDVTNSSSFDILEEWIAEIREISEDLNAMPLLAVIGNKCDMEHQRTVKRERSHKYAADNGFYYHDMSARTGEAVSLCIVNLAAKILGIRLSKADQDFHKPIVVAEIGDSVDLPLFKNRKIVRRRPNKKKITIHHFHPHLPMSKTVACSLQ